MKKTLITIVGADPVANNILKNRIVNYFQENYNGGTQRVKGIEMVKCNYFDSIQRYNHIRNILGKLFDFSTDVIVTAGGLADIAVEGVIKGFDFDTTMHLIGPSEIKAEEIIIYVMHSHEECKDLKELYEKLIKDDYFNVHKKEVARVTGGDSQEAFAIVKEMLDTRLMVLNRKKILV